MYENVLVCVDLAAEPEEVLLKAKECIRLHDADYQVIYCIEKPVTGLGELESGRALNSWTQLKHEVFPHLKEAVEKAGLDPAKTSVEIGHITDTLLDVAQEGGHDLILIGSHGRHGWRLLLGSTANSILHHAKVDVLAIRIDD